MDKLVGALYERLCAEPDLMPNFYLQISFNEGIDRAVADYISGMSDDSPPTCSRSCSSPKNGRCCNISAVGGRRRCP